MITQSKWERSYPSHPNTHKSKCVWRPHQCLCNIDDVLHSFIQEFTFFRLYHNILQTKYWMLRHKTNIFVVMLKSWQTYRKKELCSFSIVELHLKKIRDWNFKNYNTSSDWIQGNKIGQKMKTTKWRERNYKKSIHVQTFIYNNLINFLELDWYWILA